MRRPPIDDNELDQIVKAYNNGVSVRAIARNHSRGFPTIKNALISAGIESPTRPQRKFEHSPFKKKGYCKCDECCLLRKEARTRTAEDIRRTNLKYSHNITLEEYNELVESQNGCCASCRKPETHRNQYGTIRLAVDHDRECCPGDKSCGKCTRGLLCHRCNTAEGLLRTVENVRLLAEYMERTKRK